MTTRKVLVMDPNGYQQEVQVPDPLVSTEREMAEARAKYGRTLPPDPPPKAPQEPMIDMADLKQWAIRITARTPWWPMSDLVLFLLPLRFVPQALCRLEADDAYAHLGESWLVLGEGRIISCETLGVLRDDYTPHDTYPLAQALTYTSQLRDRQVEADFQASPGKRVSVLEKTIEFLKSRISA